MTEMHDARSMLASSMVVREHAPQAPEAPSWEVRLDLQPPELKAGAAEAVPAVAVSVWDATAPGLNGSRAPVFGVIAEVGSVTACARQSAGVALKASSRIQGVILLLLLRSSCPQLVTEIIAAPLVYVPMA